MSRMFMEELKFDVFRIYFGAFVNGYLFEHVLSS
jgi:hypothetical protein